MSAAWEWDCRNQHGCRAMWQRNLVAMTQRQRQIQKQRQRQIQRQTLSQLSRNKIVETTMAATLCGNRIHSLWRNGDSDRTKKILWYSDNMDKDKEIIPCLGSEAQSFWKRNNLRGSKILSFWLWRLRDCLRLKWILATGSERSAVWNLKPHFRVGKDVSSGGGEEAGKAAGDQKTEEFILQMKASMSAVNDLISLCLRWLLKNLRGC